MADNGIATVEKREGLKMKYYFSSKGRRTHLVICTVLVGGDFLSIFLLFVFSSLPTAPSLIFLHFFGVFSLIVEGLWG